MINKHFFKTVLLFSVMIVLGLLGAYLASRYGMEGNTTANTSEVAE